MRRSPASGAASERSEDTISAMSRTKPRRKEREASGDSARFSRVVAALANEPGVSRGGKGFGSSGLKVDGKLFVFISSSGDMVAKLPKQRVDELVRAGQGERFDPGHGRLMKEWIAVRSEGLDTLALAREARLFVKRQGA